MPCQGGAIAAELKWLIISVIALRKLLLVGIADNTLSMHINAIFLTLSEQNVLLYLTKKNPENLNFQASYRDSDEDRLSIGMKI